MTTKTAPATAHQNAHTEPEPVESDELAALDQSEEMNFDQDIPERVKRFVDKGHEFWLEKPRKWRGVKLLNAAELKRVKRQAQTYARQTGRQFRTKKVTDPLMLVYRVTDAPEKKGSE
jgi:hypothetical protein